MNLLGVLQTQYSVVTSSRGAKSLGAKQRTYPQRPAAPVLVKHVFTSSQGIPVTMAVLPHSQPPTHNPEVRGMKHTKRTVKNPSFSLIKIKIFFILL
jgi:hypothetical protein